MGGIIECFLVTDTQTVRRSLRRFTYADINPCPHRQFGHNAEQDLDVVPKEGSQVSWPADDLRWPASCSCGYKFSDEDPRQLFTATLYRRSDNAHLVTLHEAPIGAMFFAPWLDTTINPQLEHNLIVRTPGGDWHVDSQSRNCTLPEDWAQQRHHCWVLHGVAPRVTVDKNGTTCAAGAGSIVAGSYHGFLRNGRLEEC